MENGENARDDVKQQPAPSITMTAPVPDTQPEPPVFQSAEASILTLYHAAREMKADLLILYDGDPAPGGTIVYTPPASSAEYVFVKMVKRPE